MMKTWEQLLLMGVLMMGVSRVNADSMISYGTEQFYLFKLSYTWEDARKKCKQEGMVMGQPEDPITFVGYLKLEKVDYVWLGARGYGSTISWNSGEVLSLSSTYWFEQPKLNDCLLSYSTNKPYITKECFLKYPVICQIKKAAATKTKATSQPPPTSPQTAAKTKATSQPPPTSPQTVDGWSSWSSWSTCFTTCYKSRKRSCSKKTCDGDDREITSCTDGQCEAPLVNGGWSKWSLYSTCNSGCMKKRDRSCTDPRPQNGGQNCNGVTEENTICTGGQCRVNGEWSLWSNWSDCSQDCVQYKHRSCSNPTPENGGRDCLGEQTSEQICTGGKCIVNGGWSSWSSFSTCLSKCHQLRDRDCTLPKPQNGGNNCTGEPEDIKSCTGGSCIVTKPGQCPPARHYCPIPINRLPASTCSIDNECSGTYKCCYDDCLKHQTCKVPLGFGRK